MIDTQHSDRSATLCAIMKDEKPYLLEWIAFHRLLGFQDIVIYSNDSTDGSVEMLDRLAAQGVISHHSWPSVQGKSPQITAYADAIKRCRSAWILFIDADEFLNLKSDDSVDAFLARFAEDVSAIAINWRLFGSNRLLDYDPAPVIGRFSRAAPRAHHSNRHCKTIARTADISESHIHRCFLHRGRYVDTLGRDLAIERMGYTPSVEHEIAQINHYAVKSRREFEDKQRRGNANRPPESGDKFTGRKDDYFTKHDLNEDEDVSVMHRLPDLRDQIALLSGMALQPAA